ncbi:MAG: hypothetical protein AAF141_12960 [Pseudomonadota bacterium]
MFPHVDRIISLVPPQHIYGFIYTVRLPQLFELEFLDARAFGPAKLAQALGEGALLVATPHLWRFALTSLGRFPTGTVGLSSTAPMPAELHNSLQASGLARLVEVYGSSETNGIGWREDPDSFFELFEWWATNQANGQLERRLPDGSTQTHPFIDRLEIGGPRHIKPVGRVDKAIQIGGLNVFPARVRDAITSVEGVREAAVRPFHTGSSETQRLKAFIVPHAEADGGSLEGQIRAALAATLAAYEIPVQFTVGEDLPRDDQGKLCDWQPIAAPEHAPV